jgi:hypothetical protein
VIDLLVFILLCLLDLLFFGNTTTSNDIPYEVMSGNLSFIADHPIKKDNKIILTNRTTALSLCLASIPQELAGSSLIG